MYGAVGEYIRFVEHCTGLARRFSAFWFFKAREEKKYRSDKSVRTRPPKIVSGFFLDFAFLVLFGGIASIIYCCIADGENASAFKIIAISVCVAVFSAIGFAGYAALRFNGVVADDKGVLPIAFSVKKVSSAMKRSLIFGIRRCWA